MIRCSWEGEGEGGGEGRGEGGMKRKETYVRNQEKKKANGI